MKKYLRAAAMMIGVASSRGAWADEDDGEQRRQRVAPMAAEHRDTRGATGLPAGARAWAGGWEATVVEGLRQVTVRYAADGTLVERHVPVEARALPPGVAGSVERVFPRHTIWRATRIETRDADFHEVFLARGDRQTVALLDEDGRLLTTRSKSAAG